MDLNLNHQVASIKSREDLADFIDSLNHDLVTHAEQWENETLSRYLAALSAWVREMDGYYKNAGQSCPSEPRWKVVGEMLLAAKHFE